MKTLFHSSAAIWCGAGITGRASFHENDRMLDRPPPAVSILGDVTTQFMGMAATYQTMRMTRQMTATGSALPGSRAIGFAAMAGAALT